MSDAPDDDRMHEEIHARFTTEIAMRQVSARLAFATFLAHCPPPPKLGTPEHSYMVAGKDASVAMALTGLTAEFRDGSLKHLTPDDMQAIGAILVGMDHALSRRLGITVEGTPLQ